MPNDLDVCTTLQILMKRLLFKNAIFNQEIKKIKKIRDFLINELLKFCYLIVVDVLPVMVYMFVLCRCLGSSHGLVVRVTQDLSRGFAFGAKAISFASVHSAANENQHWWEGTCDGLASCPGESVQLHSNCLR